jgi:TrpR-related protein YerC/YecD
MDKNNFEAVERLFETVVALETVEECAAFFEDICTYQEMDAIAQRMEVALLLWDDMRYNDVNKQTGASTATICRVSKAMNYGAGGYKTVIERMKENEN